MTWNKQKRFEALLTGTKADRPIVSGWHHFLDKEQTSADLAEATVEFAQKYDWDWVKINPRATYLAEAFGNTYDFTDYHWVFPKQTHAVVSSAKDLPKIEQVDVNNSAPLQEQLEAVRLIRQGLPDTPIIQTLFSPLTILMFLTGNSSYHDQTMYGSEDPLDFATLLQEDRAGVHRALHQIATTMAAYIVELDKAGVDGLFYATTGTAHPKLFDLATFNEFSRPYDMIVLDAMKKGRILHTCGPHADPARFDDYPVEGISWDTEAEGNPDLTISLQKTKVGGVDHHIFKDSDPAMIEQQVNKGLQATKDEPFLLVPNCAVAVDATEEALFTLRNSVK